jgi:pimeloyl-ACP methyl ester carboxylesterase
MAEESDGANRPRGERQQRETPGDKLTLPKPSLDAVIAWSDQYYFHDWHIQAHVETGECRLLDGDEEVRARGSYEECLAELESIKHQQGLPAMQGRAVVLVHGLAAPRWSMKLLARHLEQHGGYQTFVMDYASLRANIDHHAFSLSNVIRSLAGMERVDLVGHSLGNIVIRRYMAGDNQPSRAWQADPRIGRIVMIAPPNHGSMTANRLSDYQTFKTIFGDSGLELGAAWAELEKKLATPRVEFGIIAGGFGNKLGLNPFLPGDDDGRIRVATTRLAGATDFLVVPAVFDYTLNFLNGGYFVSPEERASIPLESLADRPRAERR